MGKSKKEESDNESPFINDPMNIALRELYERGGYGTYRKFHEALGTSQTESFLRMMLHGKRGVNKEIIQRVKKVLGVDLLADATESATDVSRETMEIFSMPRESWDELKRNNATFMSLIDEFKNDKRELYQIIHRLMSQDLPSRQQA